MFVLTLQIFSIGLHKLIELINRPFRKSTLLKLLDLGLNLFAVLFSGFFAFCIPFLKFVSIRVKVPIGNFNDLLGLSDLRPTCQFLGMVSLLQVHHNIFVFLIAVGIDDVVVVLFLLKKVEGVETLCISSIAHLLVYFALDVLANFSQFYCVTFLTQSNNFVDVFVSYFALDAEDVTDAQLSHLVDLGCVYSGLAVQEDRAFLNHKIVPHQLNFLYFRHPFFNGVLADKFEHLDRSCLPYSVCSVDGL